MRKQRAYSLIQVKSFDPETRTFSGIATSPEPDRLGDSIKKVKYKNPLPLLLYHNSRTPVGEARFKRATPEGTPFEATISTIDRPGAVKDRLDEAIDSLRANPPLIRGVSIGFRETEPPSYNKETGGFDFPEVEVLELSMVVIPAHQDATIRTLKEYDTGLPEPGTEDEVDDEPTLPEPRAKRAPTRSTGSRMKKSYADRIAQWENTRAAKAARQDEIQTKADDENRAKDDDERKEFDDLDVEIKDCDKELADLRRLEAREKEAAKPVVEPAPAGTPSRSRIVVTPNREKGIGFARMAMCVMKAQGNSFQAEAFAKQFYPDDSQLHAALRVKAAVGAGAALTSHWADDLVPYNILQNEFIEYLRPGSIVGKFGGPIPGAPGRNYPSLNRVPFNVRTSGFSAGLTGYWVQEGLPIPVSKATSFTATLTWAKVGGLCILTNEEVRFSNPAAEMKVRDELAKALNARVDIDFVDPAKIAVANVSPASITDGIAATAPSGTAATNVRKDLATLMALFATNNLEANDIVLIMSATMAAQISMMVNTLGQDDFPNLGLQGGLLRGIPVIVSEYLTSVGSPSTQTIIMVKAGDVYLADDGAVTIDASSEASVEMLDASLQQSGISGTGASLVSLWQSGLLGLKGTREITWKLRRSTAVQYISPAAYVAA